MTSNATLARDDITLAGDDIYHVWLTQGVGSTSILNSGAISNCLSIELGGLDDQRCNLRKQNFSG